MAAQLAFIRWERREQCRDPFRFRCPDGQTTPRLRNMIALGDQLADVVLPLVMTGGTTDQDRHVDAVLAHIVDRIARFGVGLSTDTLVTLNALIQRQHAPDPAAWHFGPWGPVSLRLSEQLRLVDAPGMPTQWWSAQWWPAAFPRWVCQDAAYHAPRVRILP